MTEFSTTIRCAYFPECSGCSFHENVDHPAIWGEIEEFFKPYVKISLHSGSVIGWRTRSKLAVRGTSAQPSIGLFRQGTHEVIGIPDCPLHHPSINRAYQSVYQQMVLSKIEPYNEQTLKGAIRYFQFVVERKSRKVQLAVVINRKGRDPQIDQFANQLYATGQFSGIWINLQHGSTNRIFGEKWYLAEGEPYIWEKMGGIEVCLHPACFAQAHLELFDQILTQIKQSLIPDQRVVEFYAGVGVIGLNCVAHSSQVIASEINPHAEECFHLSRLKLPLNEQKKIEFSLGAAAASLSLIDKAEVVIVDPPRKGLDPALLERLCAASPLKQLIYLSCGFYSFKKECEQLLAHGWAIDHAAGYLLFPGSNHVETLCIFQRRAAV